MDMREPGRIYAAGQPFVPERPPVPPATPATPVPAAASTQAPPEQRPEWTQPMMTQPIVLPAAAPATYRAGRAARGGQAGRAARGQVPLSERRWLLPAAVGVLVAGLLAGGVMAAFALRTGGASATGAVVADRTPLPGNVAGPTPLPEPSVSAEPSTPPSPTPSAPVKQQVPAVASLQTTGGKCLDVTKREDGARTRESDCSGSAEQRWALAPTGTDQYLVVNQGTGKCLDLDGESRDDGASIQLWDCHKRNNQRWIARMSDGKIQLASVYSGKCVTVEGDGRLQQHDCRDDPKQLLTVDG